MNHSELRTTLAALALGAALGIQTMPQAHAGDDARGRCRNRVEKAEDHYRHEIGEHGKNSRQAEHARAKLSAAWDRCYTEAHGWYDPNRHEWRTERDWDRNYDWDYGNNHDRRHEDDRH
jgi:hypothetical protein